jgi:hypothetical protein
VDSDQCMSHVARCNATSEVRQGSKPNVATSGCLGTILYYWCTNTNLCQLSQLSWWPGGCIGTLLVRFPLREPRNKNKGSLEQAVGC